MTVVTELSIEDGVDFGTTTVGATQTCSGGEVGGGGEGGGFFVFVDSNGMGIKFLASWQGMKFPCLMGI